MASLRLFLFMSLIGTVAFAAGRGETCDRSLGLDASAGDTERLRALLRKGTLAELSGDACKKFVVRLEPVKPRGWRVSMRDTQSGRTRTRVVTSLEHASTWLEAWLQSGFAALEVPSESAPDPQGASVPAPGLTAAVSTGNPNSAAATRERDASNAPLVLSLGPVLFVTGRGYGLFGGEVSFGRRSPRVLGIGVGAGFATQVTPTDVNYRRLFWLGPALGLSFELGRGFDSTAAFGVGFQGTSAKSDAPATALGAYVALGGDVAWRGTRRWCPYVGFEFRLAAPKLLGSSTGSVITTKLEDGELETDVSPSTLNPSAGVVSAGVRLGVKWDVGDLS